MILGLFTEIVSHGGVQRVGRHTAVILAEYGQSTGEACRLLSLNDPPGVQEIRVGPYRAQVEGFGRSKRAFVRAALGAAPRVRRAYLAHPALATLGLAMRAVRPSSRYWVHIHGVEIWRRLPLHVRAGLRLAAGIISISRYTAGRATEVNGINRARVTIIPNALDPDIGGAQSARDQNERAGAPTLLTVARLAASERYKGVDSVIRAMPAILSSVPGARYHILGDGDDRPRLEELARSIGVADAVRFLGRTSEAELAAEYRECDLFIMPSSGEGFGVAYLEAMAFGKPVIGGAHGGAPEVVEDGVTGFLVAREAVPLVAERAISLLLDNPLSSRMGCAGRRRVEERFSFDQYRDRLTRTMLDA